MQPVPSVTATPSGPRTFSTCVPVASRGRGATVLRFHISEDRTVGIVSELGPCIEPSFLAELLGQDPTPLEVFRLVSEARAPRALVEHHLRLAPELGLEGLPRVEACLRVRSTARVYIDDPPDPSGPSREADLWRFRKERRAIRADWYRYWDTSSASSKRFETDEPKSVFLSHLCNAGRTGPVFHTLHAGPVRVHIDVAIGERSVVYALGTRRYRAGVSGGRGRYRMGVSAREAVCGHGRNAPGGAHRTSTIPVQATR